VAAVSTRPEQQSKLGRKLQRQCCCLLLFLLLPLCLLPYSTVLYAGFDPLFWLHHCMVDRVLWLFQNNGGQWMGARKWSAAL